MERELGIGKYRFKAQIWAIFTGAIIASFGFGIVFPLLAIYLSKSIGLSEILIGVVMMSYMATGTIAMIVGGAWADKFGRKKIMIGSLAGEAVLICLYALLSDFWGFFAIALAEGAIGSLYTPAANAMVSDLVPSERRPMAFTVIRIAYNAGVVIGPMFAMILLIIMDIRQMFIISGIAVGAAALIVIIGTKETLSAKSADEFRYKDMKLAIKDKPFMFYVLLMGISFFIYAQLISTLPVFATKDLGISINLFPLVFATNAAMVVLLQIPITSYIVRYRKTKVMALGQFLMAIGFGMLFFAKDFAFLIAATVIFSFGELLQAGVQYALVADLSPERLRGTYMGFAGLGIGIGDSIGMFTGMALLGILPIRSMMWLVIMICGLFAAAGYFSLRKMISLEADTGVNNARDEAIAAMVSDHPPGIH